MPRAPDASSSPSCSTGSTPPIPAPISVLDVGGGGGFYDFPASAPTPGPAHGRGRPRPRCAEPALAGRGPPVPGRGVRADHRGALRRGPVRLRRRARGGPGAVSRGHPVATGAGRLVLRGDPQPVALLRPGQRRRGPGRDPGVVAAPPPTRGADRGLPLARALPLQHHPRLRATALDAGFRGRVPGARTGRHVRDLLPAPGSDGRPGRYSRARSTVGPAPAAVRHPPVPAR